MVKCVEEVKYFGVVFFSFGVKKIKSFVVWGVNWFYKVNLVVVFGDDVLIDVDSINL